ncbi:DUF4870 domain-containing protein, partial [Bacillus pumilus]|uniref:DUF4870 domain-containing protein n=1 Tax=Bacillus pumilus TaxID=1408 RepID=UPI0028CB5614
MLFRQNKIFSSLSYFSIFFPPFLFPIILYFLPKHQLKYHPKNSLSTHLIPYFIFPIPIPPSGLLPINHITH